MKKTVFVFLSLLLLSKPALAIRISDTTNGQSTRPVNVTTLGALQFAKTQTRTFQVSTNLPVGSIIAWSGAGTLPHSTGKPEDIQWLLCDGSSFSSKLFPDLARALGTTTLPNLDGRFLRGTTDSAKVGLVRDDTIKDHMIDVPQHTHEFKGTITDQTARGTAFGHDYSFDFTQNAVSGNEPKTASQNLKFEKFKTNYVKPSFEIHYTKFDESGNAKSEYLPKESGGDKYGGWVRLGAAVPGLAMSESGEVSLTGNNVVVGIVSGMPVGSAKMGDNFSINNDQVSKPTVSGNVRLSVIGTGASKTEGGTVVGHFTKTNGEKTELYADAHDKEMYAYYISKGKDSDTENAMLNKYDPDNTETAPLHVYVKYYIRAR